MPLTMMTAAELYEEAARCERIAGGVSDPDLIACLLAWAVEYRQNARRLTA